MMLEAAEADIEFAHGRFVVKRTDRTVGLFEVAAAAFGDGIPAELRGPVTGISDETISIPSYAYACAVCEVEVDPETGLRSRFSGMRRSTTATERSTH